ncbi:aldehyde dehydrogenase [Marinococcus halophilus]|uniref:3-sulfolactaldehyde dehydrogenase n=1 Tax=Marinococcus halophilus TaxID=1371 RepID=A0A510Y6T4_MARHA|nr:aldehyde dehydrogenase family protein [Marinococcus halophilus]OZT79716.1 aldehyde dehydrogenase [Marinococcus halophilus]GEK59072.1 aldehyde dehydrogenase [Marinococcus halophilus]
MQTFEQQKEFGLFINNQTKMTEQKINILDKYSLQPIAQVARAGKEDVEEAVRGAQEAFKTPLSPYERYQILQKAAAKLREQQEGFANLLVKEVGKPINESMGEVFRSALTLEIAAEEGKRVAGEGVPIEAAPGSENRRAYTVRKPVGVIAAITPFNVPLNLVCHKIGPALASGNSVVLKPSDATPLVALKLAEILKEAGLPTGKLQVLTGHGAEIGNWLLENNKVNMFTFTGSTSVGKYIKEHAGLRKVALELGNNSATIVHHDTDVQAAAKAVALKSFNNAGQVCISVQRVFVHRSVHDEFVQHLKKATESIQVGDPGKETTDVGPMISEDAAQRVEDWVAEAVHEGAKIQVGGQRKEAVFYPTVLTNVTETMRVSYDEIFGPVVCVEAYTGTEESIQKVNNSDYGLQAGIFTNDLNFALQAAEEIEVGGVIINDTPGYRVDHMPYGGVKNSGTGKEGPKYAIEEMTEEKLIVWNR